MTADMQRKSRTYALTQTVLLVAFAGAFFLLVGIADVVVVAFLVVKVRFEERLLERYSAVRTSARRALLGWESRVALREGLEQTIAYSQKALDTGEARPAASRTRH